MEALVAESLAAVAAAAGFVGLTSASRRPGSPRSLLPRVGLRSRHVWLGGSAVAGALIPGPKLATVPLTLLTVVAVRRLGAARTAARRRREMDAEVPQLLDLLAAASAAGLSSVAGFRRALSAVRGPLGDELRLALDAVDLGSRWSEELAAASDRLALPDLKRAVAVLLRTETLGTSLTDSTRQLAADVRSARRAAVAERARTAPVKMLFPLVFLVLPAFLLLTVVPVLLTTVQSIR